MHTTTPQGPQYVCTNYSIFVCPSCSGVHREFNHRVKSVSMAKFTPEEVAALQQGANQQPCFPLLHPAHLASFLLSLSPHLSPPAPSPSPPPPPTHPYPPHPELSLRPNPFYGRFSLRFLPYLTPSPPLPNPPASLRALPQAEPILWTVLPPLPTFPHSLPSPSQPPCLSQSSPSGRTHSMDGSPSASFPQPSDLQRSSSARASLSFSPTLPPSHNHKQQQPQQQQQNALPPRKSPSLSANSNTSASTSTSARFPSSSSSTNSTRFSNISSSSDGVDAPVRPVSDLLGDEVELRVYHSEPGRGSSHVYQTASSPSALPGSPSSTPSVSASLAASPPAAAHAPASQIPSSAPAGPVPAPAAAASATAAGAAAASTAAPASAPLAPLGNLIDFSDEGDGDSLTLPPAAPVPAPKQWQLQEQTEGAAGGGEQHQPTVLQGQTQVPAQVDTAAATEGAVTAPAAGTAAAAAAVEKESSSSGGDSSSIANGFASWAHFDSSPMPPVPAPAMRLISGNAPSLGPEYGSMGYGQSQLSASPLGPHNHTHSQAPLPLYPSPSPHPHRHLSPTWHPWELHSPQHNHTHNHTQQQQHHQHHSHQQEVMLSRDILKRRCSKGQGNKVTPS
ncbi:unnamed protein product [Closterium sp. NIES-53]